MVTQFTDAYMCPGPHFTNNFAIIIQIQIQWKIGFSVIPIVGYRIFTKFFICHDSTAVTPCAKFHSNHFTTTRMIFALNLNYEKSFPK